MPEELQLASDNNITQADIQLLLPSVIMAATMVARLTRTTKDDELVRRLQKAEMDGSLSRAIASLLGIP